MTSELILRIITSLLVLGSLPPLAMLIQELLQRPQGKRDSVEFALFLIYATFLVSGVITLYINVLVTFFGENITQYTTLALVRNILKSAGILLVSWKLYFIMKGGAK